MGQQWDKLDDIGVSSNSAPDEESRLFIKEESGAKTSFVQTKKYKLKKSLLNVLSAGCSFSFLQLITCHPGNGTL